MRTFALSFGPMRCVCAAVAGPGCVVPVAACAGQKTENTKSRAPHMGGGHINAGKAWHDRHGRVGGVSGQRDVSVALWLGLGGAWVDLGEFAQGKISSKMTPVLRSQIDGKFIIMILDGLRNLFGGCGCGWRALGMGGGGVPSHSHPSHTSIRADLEVDYSLFDVEMTIQKFPAAVDGGGGLELVGAALGQYAPREGCTSRHPGRTAAVVRSRADPRDVP